MQVIASVAGAACLAGLATWAVQSRIAAQGPRAQSEATAPSTAQAACEPHPDLHLVCNLPRQDRPR